MDKEITCITCPISCRINVRDSKSKDSGYDVSGEECSRGVKYALSEISDPRRIFTSTVRVDGGEIKLVPVRTDRPIKKGSWKQAAKEVKALAAPAPVVFGKVIKRDFTEKGINLVAARDIDKA